MDRLISSWQKIGDYVDSYSYYSYDDKGRAYRSDFCLMGTSGGDLTQTYTSTYDADDGSLTSINVSYAGATPVSNTLSYNYDSLKRLSQKTYGTDHFQIAQNYTYVDMSGTRTGTQVTGYSVNINNITSKNYSYTYDNLGNIKTISDNGVLHYEYVYDSQGQLITVYDYYNTVATDYMYDAYGNFDGICKYNFETEEFIYEEFLYTYGDSQWKDRLTAYDGEEFIYDNIGNPLSYYNGNFYTFTWKNGRELATAQRGNTSVSYQYGADGLRTKKTVNGWDYNYYYSDGLLVRQTWADGETIDFLYDESGLPYSFIYNGTQYYYVKNLQNDVIAIVNTSGNIVVEYEYDDWGDVYASGSMASTVGAVNPIRYRSYYYDTETRFYYLESRYYDPAIRRFINADGYVNANGDILGFNMYAYCSNNPVNYDDETGCGFFKNAIKWVSNKIVDPIVNGCKEALSNIDATYTRGLSGSISTGIWTFNFQIGLSFDADGNIALQATFAGGVSSSGPAASVGIYEMRTNAPTVDHLTDEGYQFGGTVSVQTPWVVSAVVGGELNVFPDQTAGKSYYGKTSFVGIGTPTVTGVSGEVHGEWGYTGNINDVKINIFSGWNVLNDKINSW